MSSFLVSYNNINRVLTGYYAFCRNREFISTEDLTKLGQKLLLMNLKALNQCYGDKLTKENKDYALMYIYVDVAARLNKYQALKSMQCLSYQCSEGNVPKMKLYKWLNDQINILESNIIDSIPEYQKAEWN